MFQNPLIKQTVGRSDPHPVSFSPAPRSDLAFPWREVGGDGREGNVFIPQMLPQWLLSFLLWEALCQQGRLTVSEVDKEEIRRKLQRAWSVLS